MRISGIGAGQVGRVIERLGLAARHSVTAGDFRESPTLSDAFSSIICGVGDDQGMATFGDVAVIAIPPNRNQTIPAALLAGKPVLDASERPSKDSYMDRLDAHRATTGSLPARSLPESWRFDRAKPACCCPPGGAGLVHALAVAKRDVELAGIPYHGIRDVRPARSGAVAPVPDFSAGGLSNASTSDVPPADVDAVLVQVSLGQGPE